MNIEFTPKFFFFPRTLKVSAFLGRKLLTKKNICIMQLCFMLRTRWYKTRDLPVIELSFEIRYMINNNQNIIRIIRIYCLNRTKVGYFCGIEKTRKILTQYCHLQFMISLLEQCSTFNLNKIILFLFRANLMRFRDVLT